MTKYFEKILSLIAWVEIVISIFLLGLIIAAIIYFTLPNKATLIICCVITIASLISSILIANHYWKNKKTLWLISRNSATPELETLE
jgi:hypothetical protein